MKFNVAPQNSKLRSQLRGQSAGESNKAESIGLNSQIAIPREGLAKKLHLKRLKLAKINLLQLRVKHLTRFKGDLF